MTIVFQTFVDRLADASDRENLSEALVRFADALGIARFAYLDFRSPGAHLPLYLTNYPTEWVYHYISRRYQEIDPVVIRSRHSVLPFFWDQGMSSIDDRVAECAERRRFFGEAAEFGIQCGLSIPVHGGHGQAMISLVSDRKPATARSDIENHRDILHLASMYFHVHARRKLEGPVPLDPPRLSPAEIACLQWVARGNRPWDIGEKLALPNGTVLFHLKNARQKLQASTLSQAVAVALYYQLIEF
jgi:LuxR family transcriptional regulator, activator of conjugal transfer of Ti plasmids